MIGYSLEVLAHFSCSDCEKWWSIALEDGKVPQSLICPYCGVEAETKEMSPWNSQKEHSQSLKIDMPGEINKITS